MIWVFLANIALYSACFLSILVVLQAWWFKDKGQRLTLMRYASHMAIAGVAFSFVALLILLINHAFFVRYVAMHSNLSLPWYYRIAAAWGGHEGSLLLWTLIFCAWIAAFNQRFFRLPEDLYRHSLATLHLLLAGFILFIVSGSSPFELIFPAPQNGADLNPLLQDIGLILHPPFLYMGYVGSAIVFALAMAALITGKADREWANLCRPWLIASWLSLSLGILLGSMWAYGELGWGGWWFWDPVENASLMPWLMMTALLHTFAVSRKRGVFRHWSILLAISSFALSLLGTFLVRSGVLTSVHAFAADATRGMSILLFMLVTIGASLWLYARRAPALQQNAQSFGVYSRETFLLVNTIILVTSCVTVLVGTLFPLAAELFSWGRFSVGAPYFVRILSPLWLILLCILPLSIEARWKQDTLRRQQSLWLALYLPTLLIGFLLPLWGEFYSWPVGLCFALALSVATASFNAVYQRSRQTKQPFYRLSLSFLGKHLAHLGLAIFMTGAAVVSVYDRENDVVIYPQQTVHIDGYDLTFRHLTGKTGQNYQALIGSFTLEKNGQQLAWLHPEKRQYLSGSMPMSEAAVYRRVRGDIYMTLGEMQGTDPATSPWTIRFYQKPLMNWVWAGVLMMILGGLMAFFKKDKRHG